MLIQFFGGTERFCEEAEKICDVAERFCEEAERIYEAAERFCEEAESFCEATERSCEEAKTFIQCLKDFWQGILIWIFRKHLRAQRKLKLAPLLQMIFVKNTYYLQG